MIDLRVVAVSAPELPEGRIGRVLTSRDPTSLFNATRLCAERATASGKWGESNWACSRTERRKTLLLMHSLREDTPAFVASLESAGKRKNTRTRPQRWLKTAMVQAAHAAGEEEGQLSQGEVPAPAFATRGKKAILAIAATMLRAIYHILTERVPYQDLGPDFLKLRNRKHATRSLVRRLQGLGYEVELSLAA
jgi:hypothetical protein